MIRTVAVIPVKGFDAAKRRLGSRLTGDRRAALSRALAGRTATIARDAGADVLIVTDDDAVASWAERLGLAWRRQLDDGLNGAASTGMAVAARRGRPWAVIHADLPWVGASDLRRLWDPNRAAVTLVPSRDGGTNVVVGIGDDFRFQYGVGSFQRHLAVTPNAAVHVSAGLSFDLDHDRDLAAACAHRRGWWLRRVVGDPLPG